MADRIGLEESRPGTSISAFGEDMPDLVVAATRSAPTHCGACLAYHGVWPALRLSESVGGIDVDGEVLVPYFRRLASERGSRRWLICGMADTGLYAAVAAGIGSRSDSLVSLVDRCMTPLALCRKLADRAGSVIALYRADLAAFEPAEAQDVVFAHSILHHLAAGDREAMLLRIRSWLRPGGTLVMAARVADGIDAERVAADATTKNIGKMIIDLRARGVTDAEALDRLREWLPRYFSERPGRRGLFDTSAAVLRLLRHAGFPDVRILAEFTPPARTFRSIGVRQQRLIVTAVAG